MSGNPKKQLIFDDVTEEKPRNTNVWLDSDTSKTDNQDVSLSVQHRRSSPSSRDPVVTTPASRSRMSGSGKEGIQISRSSSSERSSSRSRSRSPVKDCPESRSHVSKSSKSMSALHDHDIPSSRSKPLEESSAPRSRSSDHNEICPMNHTAVFTKVYSELAEIKEMLTETKRLIMILINNQKPAEFTSRNITRPQSTGGQSDLAIKQEKARADSGDSEYSRAYFYKTPITTLEEFRNVEKILADSKEEKKLIRELAMEGGETVSKKTRNVMKRVMSNRLMREFNLEGKGPKTGNKTVKSKLAFAHTKLYKIVIAAVMECLPRSKSTEIRKAIGNYLKGAPLREGGGQEKIKQEFDN